MCFVEDAIRGGGTEVYVGLLVKGGCWIGFSDARAAKADISASDEDGGMRFV